MNKAFPYLVLFLLTNLIFVGLYRHFLLGHAAYMYADIGNDSLSSSYPILVMLSRLFHDGNLTAYDLTAGLGTDISATYLQYINPIKLMMLVFPTAKLPAAIICSTWVQVNLLALFGCLYFRQMLKNVWAAVVAALCWTYTGYVVLWGQNYSFLTTILLFTMTLYLLEMVLDGASLKITLWFTPVTALFLLSNYYFLYMTVVFAVFYVLLRCLFIKVKPLDYLKRIGVLAILAVGGALMGAISVPSILSAFFSSNRTGAVSEAGAAFSRIFWYSPAEYLTMLGRLFSINLFGPGSGYTGALNYYEMVELAVSSLFLFALVYL
ncbi:MAG: YfhO family protein, partial [Lachnospiraceae bacterium]|nr:YfhO family protein [Candidatus Equihabitans merdae]